MRPDIARIYSGATLEFRPLLSKDGLWATVSLRADFADVQKVGKTKLVDPESLRSSQGTVVPVEKIERPRALSAAIRMTARIETGKQAILSATAAPDLGPGKVVCLIVKVEFAKGVIGARTWQRRALNLLLPPFVL